jgi:hypothetical protein
MVDEAIRARRIAVMAKAAAAAAERELRERYNKRPLKVLPGVKEKTGRHERYYNVRRCGMRHGEVIEAYGSVREASEATGITYNTIASCLRCPEKHKSAGGWKWKAAERMKATEHGVRTVDRAVKVTR